MIGFRFDPATCTAMGAKAEATVVHHVADKTHTWKEALRSALSSLAPRMSLRTNTENIAEQLSLTWGGALLEIDGQIIDSDYAWAVSGEDCSAIEVTADGPLALLAGPAKAIPPKRGGGLAAGRQGDIAPSRPDQVAPRLLWGLSPAQICQKGANS